MIGRAPIRQNSENAKNNTRQAASIRDRNTTTRDLSRITEQGVSARIQPANAPVEIGGALDARNEVRDNRTFERNRDYVLPAGVMHTQEEEHYMDIVEYHVTLVAQADRTIRVLSTRALAAGGIGAAGGGVTGAAAGAEAGATAGIYLKQEFFIVFMCYGSLIPTGGGSFTHLKFPSLLHLRPPSRSENYNYHHRHACIKFNW